MSDVERCFTDCRQITWSVIDRDIPNEFADSYTFTAWYRLERR